MQVSSQSPKEEARNRKITEIYLDKSTSTVEENKPGNSISW